MDSLAKSPPYPATRLDLGQAAGRLREGGLVAFPTETVYGLGADATSDAAVASVYVAKGRPSFNPLIAHTVSLSAAEAMVVFSPLARVLAERFWPGPLTLVLPRRPDCPVSLLASAGLDSLAVRIPAHPVALALLAQVGRPVVAPSANPSGRVSPTTADHVIEGFRAAPLPIGVLDGGPCRVGVESTVVQVDGDVVTLLRPGGVPREVIEAALSRAVAAAAPVTGSAPVLHSPGQLESHYAPDLPVRVGATAPRPGELLLGFGHAPHATCNLSPVGDVVDAAANLFSMLRAIDALGRQSGATGIAVMAVPNVGLGEAVNDRLRRAAAARP